LFYFKVHLAEILQYITATMAVRMKSFLLIALAYAALGRRVQREKSSILRDVLGVDASAKTSANSQGQWNPFYSFKDFFLAKGYTTEQIAKIQAHFLNTEQMHESEWPLRDHAQELLASANNLLNNNKKGVADAIEAAGGDCKNSGSLTSQVIKEAEDKLAKKKGTASSSFVEISSAAAVSPFASLPWVTNKVASNMDSVTYLSNTMNMLSGSVATNTGAIATLTATVGANSAAISSLQGTVGLMSQVAAPTMQLAGALGVAPGTVATLALAGSFVGPMVGVIALIYVTWPEEETDPWLQVEARVNQMITDRFDSNRRKRLGDRLRRYIRQFSQCAKAWVATAMVRENGVALPRWIVEDAESAKKTGNFNFTSNRITGKVEHDPHLAAPPCMEELEGHMSLERDLWYKTEGGQMGGLFMPFANMHTQMLSLLADHPYDDKMQWRPHLQSTAAEYGAYMLDHMLSAWKSQVCRTVRLRQSKDGIFPNGWRYNWVVLKREDQPHAAEDCSSHCSEQGWCDWCGGQDFGACCQAGNSTGGVCSQFSPPYASGIISSSSYKACVHTDCIQSETRYYGTEVKKIEGGATPFAPEDCQKICQDMEGAAFFSTTSSNECVCLGKDDAKRHQEAGASSGPVVCGGKLDDSVETLEGKYEENLVQAAPNVPMLEVEPCDEKSPTVGNYPEVEEKHGVWVEGCYRKVAKSVTEDYNKFYEKYGRFVDSMAWQAGCGAQRELQWNQGGWLEVSNEFDGGSFIDCDWAHEKSMDDGQEALRNKLPWLRDADNARGWFGMSKVVKEDQAKATMPYPMPSWLHDLKRQQSCLRKTAAGKVSGDNADERSTALSDMMGPTAMDEASMSTMSTPSS
jgi:hypothetical protein